MAKRVIDESLRDFSASFTRFHRLPNGVQLRIWNGKRYVRGDFTIKRHAINATTLGQLNGGSTVRDLLDQAESVLSMNLKARKRTHELYLVGTDGNAINGNTHVDSVRELDPLPNDASDAKAREVFASLFDLMGIATSAKKRDILYDELRAILDQSFEKALLDNAASIKRRKS